MFADYMYKLVESESFKLLGIFIDFVRDPDIKGKTNETALYRVTQKLASDPTKNSEMVKFLINKGADFLWQHEITGFSPAVHIIQCEDGDLVDFLISKLNHINIPADSVGGTALHHAVRCGNEKTVLKLLRKGANPNQKNLAGNSSMHEAVLSKEGHKLLKLLLQYGGDINQQTDDGLTPLHLVAFTQAKQETLYSVLQCKPLLDEIDAVGRTPLTFFLYSMEDSFEEIAMLLDSGSNVNVKNYGGLNLLHIIAKNNSSFSPRIQKITRLLIESGIDIDGQTLHEKNTPLHMAILHNNTELAEYLVVNRANLFLQNALGHTPFDTAIMGSRLNMVSIILSHAILNNISEEKLINKSGVGKIERTSFMGFIVESTVISCEREIRLMKETRLENFPSITFYDLAVIKEKKLVDFLKKSKVKNSLDFKTRQFRAFVYYKYLLKERVHLALRCRSAKDDVSDYLCSSASQSIPQICLERTVSHMDVKSALRMQRQILNYLSFNRHSLDEQLSQLSKFSYAK